MNDTCLLIGIMILILYVSIITWKKIDKVNIDKRPAIVKPKNQYGTDSNKFFCPSCRHGYLKKVFNWCPKCGIRLVWDLKNE